MCGRFSLGVDTDRLIAEFGITSVIAEHTPRYNIAPGQDVPAVVADGDEIRLGAVRWGLLPAAEEGTGSPRINVRGESVDRVPAYASSFRRRRCWILADGFYEWTAGAGGVRQPFHFRLPDRRPFALAGIWDRRDGEDDPPTCAILTTRPSAVVEAVHDRMPVLLPRETRDRWLDPRADRRALTALIRPSTAPLESVPVSPRVNTPAHDDPSCVDAIDLP
jgi:putative SOS response-associated peptidase YedK